MSVIDRLEAIVSTPASPNGPAPRETIDIDSALSLLANGRRRQTIRYAIDETDGEFDLVDATEYIATEQYGPEYTSSERKRVYISLYQTHLPELVEAGVLDRVDDGPGHTFRVDDAAQPLYDVLEATAARLGGDV